MTKSIKNWPSEHDNPNYWNVINAELYNSEKPEWIKEAMKKANEDYEASMIRLGQIKRQENAPKSKKIIKKPLNKKSIRLVENTKLIPEQPIPITIDNFFISTSGIFNELESIPSSFRSFFKSKGSEYFTDPERKYLIRVSDHWGFHIRFCDWFLKPINSDTPEKISSFKWSKKNNKMKRIGIICYSDFNINERLLVGPQIIKEKIESRWPI